MSSIETKNGVVPYISEYIYDDKCIRGDFSKVKEDFDESTGLNYYLVSDYFGRTFRIYPEDKGRPVGCFVAIDSGVIGVSFINPIENFTGKNIKREDSRNVALARALLVQKGKCIIVTEPSDNPKFPPVGVLADNKAAHPNSDKRIIYVPKQYQKKYFDFVERSKKYFRGEK
jgi:hypothetical protein